MQILNFAYIHTYRIVCVLQAHLQNVSVVIDIYKMISQSASSLISLIEMQHYMGILKCISVSFSQIWRGGGEGSKYISYLDISHSDDMKGPSFDLINRSLGLISRGNEIISRGNNLKNKNHNFVPSRVRIERLF